MDNEGGALTFGNEVVRGRRLPDRVADMMLETIRSRGLQPGDRLPSERELGEQFAVSRAVIREAVRSLAARGVVTSNPGRGLTVAAVDAEAVSASMNLYLRGNHDELPYERVHEVRTTLELDVARLAAERAREPEIVHLRETHARLREVLDDVEQSSLADVAFHRELAKLTHNPLYVIILDSIGDVLLEIRRATMGNLKDAERGCTEHGRILAAVARHDPDAAHRAMRGHLTHALREWKKLGLVRVPSGRPANGAS
jgi:GntR family transcriptional regulator, transcriptional repressor for pyruvate dehydrogenase complex